jgi:ribosomal protein S18 acetylase RimI-like enzyme
MSLSIRKSELDDAKALAEILTQAMKYKLSLGDKAGGTEPYTEQEVQDRISKGDTYTVWFDDKVAGTLMLVWEDKMMWGEQPPVAAYVHQLAIKDGYRGHRIGEQLLDWASKQTAEKGRKLLRIDFPPQNTGLKRYYEKLGFKFVMDREIQAPHATYTAALYERPVKQV